MIQKIFSLKNKILAVLLIILIPAIIYIISIDKYNQDFFLKTIENKLNLEINNQGSYNINFFPKFHLIQKDLEIFKKFNNYSILSRNIDIDLIKKYLNWNKTFFQINSLSTVVKGITIRNIKVNGFDQNSEIKINEFFSDINEGKLFLKGNIKYDKNKEINLEGNFENISFTRLLNQSGKIKWKRLNIKLKSEFKIKTNGLNDDELIKNLNGNFPVKGLFYINATQEERFGTALLNALSSKIEGLSSISKSLDFLFTNYADVPSIIEGKIIIENGIVKTEKLFITNNNAEMSLDLIYDIIEDNINGTLFFYDNDKIYLKAKLEGSINNPQILVGGKPFIQKDEELKDIKKIIEEGITNIFQKILDNN